MVTPCPARLRRPADLSPRDSMALRINYVFEEVTLFGGNKVLLHQANLLARRGHDVTVTCSGPPPDWYPLDSRCRFIQLALPLLAAAPAALPPADVPVATFWTTLPPVAAPLAPAGPGD